MEKILGVLIGVMLLVAVVGYVTGDEITLSSKKIDNATVEETVTRKRNLGKSDLLATQLNLERNLVSVEARAQSIKDEIKTVKEQLALLD